MAKLLKERARNPLVETGFAHGTACYDGNVRAYRIALHQRDNRQTYEIILTREEMLDCVAEWMKEESNRARAEAKAAAAKAGAA